MGWSPEQISGRMELEGVEHGVCTESIYRHVFSPAGRRAGPSQALAAAQIAPRAQGAEWPPRAVDPEPGTHIPKAQERRGQAGVRPLMVWIPHPETASQCAKMMMSKTPDRRRYPWKRLQVIGIDLAITMAHCWAHVRRKLREVFDRDKSPIAADGLRRIAEFYAIEEEIRGTNPGQRLSRAPGPHSTLGRGLRLLAQRTARPRLQEVQAQREAHLHRQPLRRPPSLPRRRSHRNRLQRGRKPDPTHCPQSQKRPLRGSLRRRQILGPHRLPDRNRQDQRRRSIRLSQIHTRAHRQRPP